MYNNVFSGEMMYKNFEMNSFVFLLCLLTVYA